MLASYKAQSVSYEATGEHATALLLSAQKLSVQSLLFDINFNDEKRLHRDTDDVQLDLNVLLFWGRSLVHVKITH